MTRDDLLERIYAVPTTSPPAGGEKYAALVRGSLERRCDVTRTPDGPDENDRWMATLAQRRAA